MRINTTVYIRSHALERISAASADLGVSRSVIVSALLMHARRLTTARESRWGQVKYQERQENGSWHRLHLRPASDEYEFFIDLRKISKLSVSFLVAIAVEQYLDELVEKWGKEIDNYHFRNYAKSHFYIENIPCWVYYWGIPTKLLEASS